MSMRMCTAKNHFRRCLLSCYVSYCITGSLYILQNMVWMYKCRYCFWLYWFRVEIFYIVSSAILTDGNRAGVALTTMLYSPSHVTIHHYEMSILPDIHPQSIVHRIEAININKRWLLARCSGIHVDFTCGVVILDWSHRFLRYLRFKQRVVSRLPQPTITV